MMVEWSEPAWSQTLNKIYTPSEKVLIYPGYLLSESKVSVRVSHRKLLTSSGSSVRREIPTGPATICQVCFHHSLP